MAYTPGNQVGSGKSKIIDNRIKKGGGDRKKSGNTDSENIEASQSLAGTYKTETINGQAYTSFVPDNVQIKTREYVVSGGKPSREVARELANVPTQINKTATIEGRRTTDPVPVSPGVYNKVTGQELARQEPNTRYFVETQATTPMPSKTFIQAQPSQEVNNGKDQTQLAENLFTNNWGNASNGNIPKTNSSYYDSFSNYGNNQSSKKTPFEKQIDLLDKWEKGAAQRQQNLNNFFTNIIKGSPYRAKKTQEGGYGTNIPDLSFGEKAVVGIVSLPVTGTIGFGESVGIIGFKAALIAQGRLSFDPKIREATKAEETRAKFLTPPITTLVKNTFNVMTPEGVVNIVGVATLPSFINKGVQSAQSLTFIGKTKIPAETIVEPKVLTGEKTFPSSSKPSPALLDEFKNSPFQKPIKDLLGQDTQGGFSASPSPIKTRGGVQKGTSATPGLYIAPSLSKYFLKLSGEGGTPSFSLFPKLSRPSANYIVTEGIGLIPEPLVRSAERKSGAIIGLGGQREARATPGQRRAAVEELNKYFENDLVGSGRAAVTPEFYLGKGEKEALIGQGSSLKVIDSSLYTEISGRKVPLRIIKAGKTTEEFSLEGLRNTIADVRARGLIKSSYKAPKTNIPLYGSITPSRSYARGGGSSGSRARVYDSSGNILSDEIYRPSNRRSESIIPEPREIFTPTRTREPTRTPERKNPIIPRTPYEPRTPTRTKAPYNPLIPSVPSTPTTKIPNFGGRGSNKLFSVEIRRFGQFKEVDRGLTRAKAIEVGKGIARGTAARTFRLKSGGVAVPINEKLSGFYSKGNLNIEQASFGIDSPGELSEITFAPRKRRKAFLI